jgi:hypothetical protein
LRRAIAFTARAENHRKAGDFRKFLECKSLAHRRNYHLFVVLTLEVLKNARDLRDFK